MMTCEECVDKLHDYIDRELTGDSLAEIDRHLKACAPCLDRFEFSGRLKQLVRTRAATQAVPSDLTERIRAQLRQVPVTPLVPSQPRPVELSPWQRMGALAASVMLGVFIASALVSGTASTPRRSAMLAALVRDHLQCWQNLQSSPPISMDEARTELAHGLTQPVRLPQLPVGYQPVAARVCKIDGRRIAHLFVRRDAHGLSCFVIDRARSDAPDRDVPLAVTPGSPYQMDSVDNQTLMLCVHSDATYCLVSDEPASAVKDLALESGW